MLPFVGFVTLSVFGGYSIYFPEIYPTRLRSTGTAFCYNVARILTALIIVLAGPVQAGLRAIGVQEVFRWGAVILCSFYLLGIVVLVFAPETKDRPLPRTNDGPGRRECNIGPPRRGLLEGFRMSESEILSQLSKAVEDLDLKGVAPLTQAALKEGLSPPSCSPGGCPPACARWAEVQHRRHVHAEVLVACDVYFAAWRWSGPCSPPRTPTPSARSSWQHLRRCPHRPASRWPCPCSRPAAST